MSIVGARRFFTKLEASKALRNRVGKAEAQAALQVVKIGRECGCRFTATELEKVLSERWAKAIVGLAKGDDPDDPSVCHTLSERPGF